MTRLSEVVVPDTFTALSQLRSLHMSAVFQTGVAQVNGTIAAFAASNQGQIVNMPRFGNLAQLTAESNRSSDNPASNSTPATIQQTTQKALKQARNQSWSEMDLTAELNSGERPMVAIANSAGDYWAKELDNNAISCLRGKSLALEAQFSGEVIYSAGNDPADLGSEVIKAAGLMGDLQSSMSVFIMHSKLYTQLNLQNLIDFIPDARGEVYFPTYQGKRVIESDAVLFTAGSPNVYHCLLTVPGALGYGDGAPVTPTEIDREPASGDGGGQSILYNRRGFVFHMDGLSYDDTTTPIVNGQTPSNTTLATANAWTAAGGVWNSRKYYPVVGFDVGIT